MSTPSEKPTCEHGQIEEHSFLAQVRIGRIGNGVHYTTETMWCLGPVIATEPEAPVDESVRSQVSNEYALPSETPVSEATVTDEDAIEMWHALDQAHGISAHDAMKAALEAFVARKLKAETTP